MPHGGNPTNETTISYGKNFEFTQIDKTDQGNKSIIDNFYLSRLFNQFFRLQDSCKENLLTNRRQVTALKRL